MMYVKSLKSMLGAIAKQSLGTERHLIYVFNNTSLAAQCKYSMLADVVIS